MMKKSISVILILASALFGILLGVYNNVSSNDEMDTRRYAQAIFKYQGFDSVLDDADIIVTGTVDRINIYNEYDEYIITVTDNKKGKSNKKMVIRNYLYDYTYTSDNTDKVGSTKLDYEIGKSYIFVLQHTENVYESVYTIMSDVYIPMDNIEKSSVLSEQIDCNYNCEQYIDQYSFDSGSGNGKDLSIEYIKSNNEDVIINQSAYIAKVQIQELLRSTDIVDVYICDVTESIKGDFISNNQIIIPFFKDTVKKGNSYIVCLDLESEDSIIYTLSSKNSVIEAENAARVKSKVRR